MNRRANIPAEPNLTEIVRALDAKMDPPGQLIPLAEQLQGIVENSGSLHEQISAIAFFGSGTNVVRVSTTRRPNHATPMEILRGDQGAEASRQFFLGAVTVLELFGEHPFSFVEAEPWPSA